MSPLAVVWTLAAGICLSLGVVQLLIGLRRRPRREYLVFAAMALVAAGAIMAEIATYHVTSVEEYRVGLKSMVGTTSSSSWRRPVCWTSATWSRSCRSCD